MSLIPPIGISDFRHLRTEGCYYVDKTQLITELVERKVHAVLFPVRAASVRPSCSRPSATSSR